MKLTTEDETESEVASRSDLERALVTLGREGNEFAVLERNQKGDHFMQAATTGTSRFIVEYREGKGAHFQSVRTDLSISEVLALFSSYLEDPRAHADAIAWRPLHL